MTYNKDYNKIKSKIEKANKRIKRITGKYGENSWAINQLYEKLNNDLYKGINKRGYIRINKKMSDVQIKAIEKATQTFMKSKTSKLTGIEESIKNTKRGLKATLGDMKNPISNKDVNILYDLVKDKQKRDFTEKIGSSDLWIETKRAKDKNLTFSQYVKNVDKRANINIKDKEAIMFLKNTFEDYTGRMISDSELFNILEDLKIA